MSTYWMRFYIPGGDPRPMTVPPPCEWWCSGSSETHSAVCALLVTDDSPEVVVLDDRFWPDAEIDSMDEKPDGWRPSDRFPPKEETA